MSAFDKAIKDLTEVACLVSSDYDWIEVRVWTDGAQFFWATDGGCSCNSFGDSLAADDLKILDSVDSPSFREAVDYAYHMTEQEKQEFISAIRRSMQRVPRSNRA